MASTIITGSNPALLKKTLDTVYTDALKSKEYFWKKIFKESTTSELYVDDQPYAGLGLMPQKEENAAMAVDAIQEGFPTRYKQEFYGLRMLVSEQAIAFSQYDKILDGAAHLADAAYLTQEYSLVAHINRAFNSTYTIGDGLELCSTAHLLPKGGTFSNELATPVSLSELGLETVLVALRKLPGENGLRRGHRAKKLLIPSDLMFRASRILKSEKQNDTANNAVNVLKGMGIEQIDHPFMSSTTNWFVLTDADPGFRMIWSRKPTFRQTSDNSTEVKEYTASQWFTSGISDPRCIYGSAI